MLKNILCNNQKKKKFLDILFRNFKNLDFFAPNSKAQMRNVVKFVETLILTELMF